MIGCWLPLMGFNLLPSVLLLTMFSLSALSVGGPRILAAALATTLVTGAATALLVPTETRIETSFGVMVACLPLIMLFPISVGAAGYGLRRRIRTQNQQLDHLLRTERLSGFTTRQHWEEALQHAFERCRHAGGTAGLILIDVDEFKAVNDRFGHPVGDEVIRGMGEALRSVLRPGDVACRHGGDEFGVLVVGTNAAVAASRVLDSIAKFRLASTPELRCTASLGVTEIGSATASPLEAIARTDRALYLAKAAGRNRVHCVEA